MRDTFFSLFSGFDLAGVGAQRAGLECIGGIEYDAAIAEVARANGHPITVADIRHVDFKKFDKPTHLWMSPVCTNASVANANGGESEMDIDCAQACCRAISTWMPEFVFLENVYGYRHFRAFQLILHELELRGYGFDYWNLNSADYGVPQTRRRLILIARRDGLRPQRPMVTHGEKPGMFLEKWVGWYEAIEDLLPGLPESEFADWQIARLPENCLMDVNGNTSRPETSRNKDEPSFTVQAWHGRRPCQMPRAFLVDCTHRTGSDLTTRDGDTPAHTIAGSHFRRDSNVPRAFLLDATNCSRDATICAAQSPSSAVCSDGRRSYPRAFIASGMANDRGQSMTARIDGEPVFTVNAQAGGRQQIRAWLKEHGRTVKMTPRALARFQDLPDSYGLPDSAKFACKGIGNGVPCGLARAVIGSVVR